jgi:hypothetical protein
LSLSLFPLSAAAAVGGVCPPLLKDESLEGPLAREPNPEVDEPASAPNPEDLKAEVDVCCSVGDLLPARAEKGEEVEAFANPLAVEVILGFGLSSSVFLVYRVAPFLSSVAGFSSAVLVLELSLFAAGGFASGSATLDADVGAVTAGSGLLFLVLGLATSFTVAGPSSWLAGVAGLLLVET